MLPGADRQAVTHLITRFDAATASQNPRRIEAERRAPAVIARRIEDGHVRRSGLAMVRAWAGRRARRRARVLSQGETYAVGRWMQIFDAAALYNPAVGAALERLSVDRFPHGHGEDAASPPRRAWLAASGDLPDGRRGLADAAIVRATTRCPGGRSPLPQTPEVSALRAAIMGVCAAIMG